MSELIIPRRFCGPPSSGNGGWSAGELAGRVPDLTSGDARREGAWAPVQVSLRMPPPLDTPLRVEQVDGATRLLQPTGELVAEAVPAAEPPVPVDPVPFAEALAAQSSYAGLRSHPFPTCFACGPEREPGDGLRIFPGRLAGDPSRVAATWVPDPSLAGAGTQDDREPRAGLAATWAALDCSGGWAGDLTDRMMVLGRMTARIDTLPVIGEQHVVVGQHRGGEGRKTRTASTLYDADGRVVACAEHVWIAVDPEAFR